MRKEIKVIMIIISIVATIISFCGEYAYLIKDFESTAKSKWALINEHIRLSNSFINDVTIYGSLFFEEDQRNDSELYSLLKYNPVLNSYNLDSIVGTKYEKIAGNITGIGSIPTSGLKKDELNFALKCNEFFSKFYEEVPDVAWFYYTSENNFINMYPYIASRDFTFIRELKSVEFYKLVNPQNNPLRESHWTPVYLDQAGKGLMVTLSSPIYYKDTFMGVVSLDLTNAKLSELIDSKYESYLIDDALSILAANTDIKFDKEVIKFNDIKLLAMEKDNKVQRVGKNFIYSSSFRDAPWKLIVLVPVWFIVGKSVLFSLPILIICIFLFMTVIEAERRRLIERKLTLSLSELKSYQDLLENAAKYDFLTNTYNRRGFKESLSSNIAIVNNSRIPISFILGDIDYFKQINDTYGHAAGDKVLIEISNIMKQNISENEAVCRWGGEEFLIMLIDRTYDEVLIFAEKIRKEVENIHIHWSNSAEVRITMSFGVSEHDWDASIEESISKADSALYYAKENGRNQVISYKHINFNKQKAHE